GPLIPAPAIRRSGRAAGPAALARACLAGARIGHRRAGDLLGHLRLGSRTGRDGDGGACLGRGTPVRLQPGLPADELHGRPARAAVVRAPSLVARPAVRLRRVSPRGGDPRAVDLPGGAFVDRGPRAAPGDGVLRPGYACRIRDLLPGALPDAPEGHG